MSIQRVMPALLAVVLMAVPPALAQSQQPATSAAATGTPPTPPGAAADVERISKVRADAAARRNGRRARVRLIDGTVAYGRIIGVQDESLALQPTPSDEPVMYEFARVRSVEGTGWSGRVWTAVAVGAAAAVVGIVAAAD